METSDEKRSRISCGSLRICEVVEATGAGVGKHSLDLTEGLAAAGHDVHLVYSPSRAEPAWLARLDGRRGYTAHAVAMPHGISWKIGVAAAGVRRYLLSGDPFDVIHGHSSIGGGLARLAAIGLGSKVVYTPHAFAAMDPCGRFSKRLVYRNLERVLSRLTDTIICVSPEELAFARSVNIPGHCLRMVPNGVARRPLSGGQSREEIRAKFGLSSSDIAVGFVGRLSPQKAPEVLLRAFAQLARGVPNAVLAIVGDGPLKQQLVELGQSLEISPRTRWLGWHEGSAVMPAFDVLALPSRYEGLPYVALEALAAGLPIVATAAAGCGIIVESGVNGFIVPSNRPDLFGEALGRVFTDHQRHASFVRASLEKSRDFNVDRMVLETVGVYREVLGYLP